MSLHTSPPSTGIMGLGGTAAENVCVCLFLCDCLMSSCVRGEDVNDGVNTIMHQYLSTAFLIKTSTQKEKEGQEGAVCRTVGLGGGGAGIIRLHFTLTDNPPTMNKAYSAACSLVFSCNIHVLVTW